MKYTPIIFLFFLLHSLAQSQQLFIEPDFGYFRPVEKTQINLIVTNKDTTQRFDFGRNPRIGVNIGIVSDKDTQFYYGYKVWSHGEPSAKLKEHILGIKGNAFLTDKNFGIRFGAGFMINNLLTELGTWDLEWKGTGSFFETGLLYKLKENTTLFAGFNYFLTELVLDKISVDNVFYTIDDIGLTKDDVKVNMGGFNFKITISIVISKPIVF